MAMGGYARNLSPSSTGSTIGGCFIRFNVTRNRQGSQCCAPVVLFLLQRYFYEWPQHFGVEVARFALRRLVVPGLG